MMLNTFGLCGGVFSYLWRLLHSYGQKSHPSKSVGSFMAVICDDGCTTRGHAVRQACEQLLVERLPFLLQRSLDLVPWCERGEIVLHAPAAPSLLKRSSCLCSGH